MASGKTGPRAGDKSASQVTPQRIFELAWGFAPPLILEAAVRHKIFDALEASPKTVKEVAEETGASPRGLQAVMNALVGLNLLSRSEGKYALTEESGAFLVSTKRSFQGGFLQHLSRQLIPNWLQLSDVMWSGRPARAVNSEETGGAFFSQFVESLLPMNYPAAKALAESLAPELKGANGAEIPVLDLAAGSGVWGIALATEAPKVRVTAVDWPAVTPVTQAVARKHGVGDRLRVIEGDLLEVDFGTGYRIATLGHILHSEGRGRSQKLLKKVYDALAPGGTIAIAEFVLNEERTGPPQPLIFAVNMLVNTDEGDAYTFSEMTEWLKGTGFKNIRQLEVPAPSPLLLATK